MSKPYCPTSRSVLARTFGRAAVLAAVAASLLLFAGDAFAAKKTIGVIMSGDLPHFKKAHQAFVTALAKEGFGTDDVEIYVQSPNPDPMSWLNSVRKFVGVDVDVLVTYGCAATGTALKETNSIPVVFSYVYDPDANGFKKANSTGVSSKVPMMTLLKTLKAITPYKKLAVLYSPNEQDSEAQLGEIKKAASSVGYQPVEVSVTKTSEVLDKLSRASGGSDSLFISSSATVLAQAGGVLKAAGKSKLPTITQTSGLAEAGALLSLAPSSSEQGEVAARKVAAILKGAAPNKEPVESSKQVDLVLNLKTMDSLGIKVPFEILNTATRVIK